MHHCIGKFRIEKVVSTVRRTECSKTGLRNYEEAKLSEFHHGDKALCFTDLKYSIGDAPSCVEIYNDKIFRRVSHFQLTHQPHVFQKQNHDGASQNLTDYPFGSSFHNSISNVFLLLSRTLEFNSAW